MSNAISRLYTFSPILLFWVCVGIACEQVGEKERGR